MISSRNESVDIARGIAMIAVVLGHLDIGSINRVVFTFHIPIFFLITGYYMSTGGALKTVIKKRFRTLIVPYFLACAGVIVSACIFGVLRVYITGDGESIKTIIVQWIYASLYGAGGSYHDPFVIKGIGAIWFLWATFWGVIFLSVILKIKSYRVFIVLGLFAIGYYSRAICWFPLSIQAGCCATFFLYVGYLVREIKENYERASLEIRVSLFIISLCAWVNFIAQFKSFWLVSCDIGRGPLDVIGSLCACYVLIITCMAIERGSSFLSKSLAFLGQYSLFMLIAHTIELNTFPWGMLTDELAGLGFGPIIQLSAKIVCKFIWIIGITIICAKVNFREFRFNNAI